MSEHVRPLAPGFSWYPDPKGLGEWGFPGGTIPRVGLAKDGTSAPNSSVLHQDGHPPPALRSDGRCPLAARKPGFRRVQAQLPSPSRWPEAAEIGGPTRFLLPPPPGSTCRSRATCRERRGPSARGGLGNRGVLRAPLLCTEREHGGTQAVSRRTGSPREARSEGSNVLPAIPTFRALVRCEARIRGRNSKLYSSSE